MSYTPANTLQLDASPSRARLLVDFLEHVRIPPPQGDEPDAEFIESTQVLVGGELGVKDEFLGCTARVLLPILDEAQDLIVLILLADRGIGVVEHALLGILGREREHPLVATAALGDVVLLQQRTLAVKGNGVEVHVERHAVCSRRLCMASNQRCMSFG